MLKDFLNLHAFVLSEDYEAEFLEEQAWDNLERSKIIATLSGIFSILLLLLDVLRLVRGTFWSNPVFLFLAIGHFILAFTWIPAFLYFSNQKKIWSKTFNRKNFANNLTILILGVSLIWTSLCGLYSRDNLTAFTVFILIVNMIYTLPPNVSLKISLTSVIIMLIGIFYIQFNDIENLYINLIECIGFTLPTYLVAVYQHRLKAQQFASNQKIKEQQAIIEASMVSQFKKRIAEIEMTALRAQMNPHFLFNCLNSIKLCIVQNDTSTAAGYLTKFSRLIRLILNNSKSSLVRLSKELEALKLYIEMEQFRFQNKFDFQMEIGQEVNAEFVDIPPMILQPYVENAIWHGLMHKENEKGILKLNVKREGETILFIVEDNGIGREKAQSIKSRSPARYKSLGMQITKDRIEIANELYNAEAEVRIFDLKGHDGKAKGTKVVILLPLSY